MQSPKAPEQRRGRRVRHDVADAVRLAVFSLAASAGVGSLLLLGARMVGSA